MTKDKLQSHNCLFRATYLMMVLDLFVEELPKMVPGTAARFRSCALNPLLQRQLRGIIDTQAGMVETEVGKTLGDSAKFYLVKDPLDPAHIHATLRNILYVWPVRLALLYLPDPRQKDKERDPFEFALTATEELFKGRSQVPDLEWEREKISTFEVALVKEEGLELYYQELIDARVSGR